VEIPLPNNEQDDRFFLQEMRDLTERLRPDSQLGQYVLRERVGVGGMGAVFRAEDTTSGDLVAIKALVPPKQRRQVDTLARFRVQAALLAGLRHESVVSIRDIGRHADICYLVMDLVLGPEEGPVSLQEYANWFEGMVAPSEVLELFDLLLKAFGHFHAHKIVHGNIKPQNVLLNCVSRTEETWEAKVVLSDFGLSRIMGTDFVVESVRKTVQAKDARSATVTRRALPPDAKAILQSYDYMSPEQRKGQGSSRRSDVFSLGLMFLHLLTGKKVIGFQPPSKICPGIDSDWDTFILRATAQNKSRRFRSITEMHEALKRLRCS
jgi:eukaryotic-like serine/threonine-protein kinase